LAQGAVVGGGLEAVSPLDLGMATKDTAQAQAPSAGMVTLQVPVPEGVQPGGQVEFDTPDGRRMRAEVPQEKKPGDTFDVLVPQASIMITVPDGVAEGAPVQFTMGEPPRKFQTYVPPGKKSGETFEVFEHMCESVIDVQCPDGVKPGGQVSIPGPNGGQPLTVQVPEGIKPGDVFPVVLRPQLPPTPPPPSSPEEAAVQELCAAAQTGDVESCKRCLDKGASVNGTYTMGFTPIFYASTYGHAPVCKILIEARANVHCANEEGRTPLHWAARNGHFECAQLLVGAKAPLAVQDKGGRTPLGVALDKNQKTVADYLRSQGAT